MKSRKGRSSPILLLLFAFFALPSGLFSLDLYAATEVVQVSPSLSLSQVVSSYSGDSEAAELLKKTLPHPWVFPSVISPHELQSVIAGVIERPFVFSGGALIYLPGTFADPEKEPEKANFLIALLRFVQSRAENRPDRQDVRIEVEPMDEIPALQPGARVDFSLSPVSGTIGRTRTAILYKTDQMSVFRRLDVKVRLLESVLVAEKTLSANETFTESAVSSGYRVVRNTAMVPFHPAISLTSYRAARRINAGEIVFFDDVQRDYDVATGKHVDIVFEFGSIQMTMTGYLLQPANFGETVQVRVSQTGKKFDAVVQTDEVVYVGIQ